MFFGALTLATTMSFVGCKDYDDDINAINERLDANDATLTAIQGKLNSGEWVQKVEPITNGIRVTLGSGTTYDITNGEDGQNGKNGTVYEIGEDGYWYLVKEDGQKEKTGKYALAHDPKIVDGYWMFWDAAKGEYVKSIAAQGNTGDDGKDGHSPYINTSNNNWMVWDATLKDGEGDFKDSGICAKGDNGTDIWYEPNSNTKTWWKHEGDDATDTKISYLAKGTITAIKNEDGKIMLYGIPGYEDGYMLVNSRTLNSVTLIPRLFIDGIPAIDFRTLKYTPQMLNANKELVDKTGASAMTVDNGATTVYYQLSPAHLTKDDIAMPHFISNKNVETRADMGDVDDLITAKSYDVEAKGRLKVTVNKVAGGSLELTDGKINMVAAQVASSQAVLDATGKEENIITSEYTRLAETSFTPSIAALTKQTNGWDDWKTAKYGCTKDNHQHYADYTTAYAYQIGQGIASELNYLSEEPLDLRLLVTGCYMSGTGDDEKAEEITTEELKAYGLAFRFEIPQDPYTLGTVGTDQQKFAKLLEDGYQLTSQLPAGNTDKKAACDKEPIICVMLRDTVNDNLVDQKYFKVKFAEKAAVVNPIDCGEIQTFTEALSCGEYTMSVKWETITNEVYGHDDINMSKEEFTSIYTQLEKVTGTGTAELVAATDPEQGTTVLKWTIQNNDVTIAPDLSKEFTINLKYVDPTGKNGDVLFSLKTTISIDNKPALIGIVKNYWLDNTAETPVYYPVYPVHYDVDGANDQVCEYANPLINAFNKDDKGRFVKNIGLDCAGWDIQFALNDQPNGYTPDYTGNTPALSNGWKLTKGGNNLVWLSWEGSQWKASEPVIHLKRAGQDLLTDLETVQAKETAKYKNVKATVWGKANDNNYYNVKEFNFVFVNPLAIKAEIKGAFEDGIYSGSRVAIADAFTMVDFRGYTVAENAIEGATAEKEKYADKLYKYYGVEKPEWDLNMGNVKVSMKKDAQGNTIVDNQLTPDNPACLTLEEVCGADASLTFDSNTNELVFKNAKGSDTQEEYTMFVKASIKHFWGVAERIAAIKVYPNGQKPAGK